MGRIDKVNQLIKREISNILQREFEDPLFQFVTVTHVDVSPDLRHAKVFFSFLGESNKIETIITRLESVRGYIRKLIGARIRLRYTPDFSFEFDRTLEQSARIENVLAEIKNEHTEAE